MKMILMTALLMQFITGINGQEKVKDWDGNEYHIIRAGSQSWFAENLMTTHYSNGDEIVLVKDAKQWMNILEGAFSALNNNAAVFKATGLLYNWYAVVDKRNICPSGWHVPTDTEWATLVSFLIGEKEPDPFKTSPKVTPSSVEINKNLFYAMPEGFRSYEGDFMTIGNGGGGWWSSTPCEDESAYFRGINYNTVSKKHLIARKQFGYSVRCIKD